MNPDTADTHVARQQTQVTCGRRHKSANPPELPVALCQGLQLGVTLCQRLCQLLRRLLQGSPLAAQRGDLLTVGGHNSGGICRAHLAAGQLQTRKR